MVGREGIPQQKPTTDFVSMKCQRCYIDAPDGVTIEIGTGGKRKKLRFHQGCLEQGKAELDYAQCWELDDRAERLKTLLDTHRSSQPHRDDQPFWGTPA